MDKRISRALAAATVVALPLLAACGGSSTGGAAPGASTAPTTPAATQPATQAPTPSTTTAAATPSPDEQPADQAAAAQTAARKFMGVALVFDATDTYAQYRNRVKPLMTKKGFASFEEAHLDKALTKFRARYGEQARTRTKLLAAPKVGRLTSEKASVAVTFENRVEQRRNGKWQVVKRSIDDTINLPLVNQGGTWLVDDLS